MRLKALVFNNITYKKAIIYKLKEKNVYLFLYKHNQEDLGADGGDQWYETIEDAMNWAQENLHISKSQWVTIPDPPPGTLHDTEKPMIATKQGNQVILIPYKKTL